MKKPPDLRRAMIAYCVWQTVSHLNFTIYQIQEARKR